MVRDGDDRWEVDESVGASADALSSDFVEAKRLD